MRYATHTPAAPVIPPRLQDASSKLFTAGATLEIFNLMNQNLSGVVARSVDLHAGILENVVLVDAKLKKLGMRDVLCKHLDFTMSNCSEASFLRTVIANGRMTGWDVNQGSLQDVVFQGCKLDMANFRFTTLNRVRFIDCTLTETDFLNAAMTDVEFQRCTLEKVEFSQCKMKNVDLRSSQLIDLRGSQGLHGATIDSVQLMSIAPYLAQAIGIHVEDET